MPRRGRLFMYVRENIVIQITRPAEFLIGPHNVGTFVESLKELLEALGAQTARVKKRKDEIVVSIRREDGWKGFMHFKRPVKSWLERAQH